MGESVYRRRGALAWALYDVANSAFALVVLTAIYPIFFGAFWAGHMTPGDSTWWLGVFGASGSAIVAVLSPLIGAWADERGRRRQVLVLFSLAGAAATAAMGLVGQGAWLSAGLLYVAGVAGFSLANVVYDALLPAVSTENNAHKLSALGFSLGYLGSTVLLLALTFGLINQWEGLGLSSKAVATRLSFILTGAWWALWTLPLIRRVPEPPRDPAQVRPLRLLLETAREATRRRELWLFLLAYFLYIDGVNTIIRMASKIASDIGTPVATLTTAIVLVQLVAVPFAMLFGWWGQRFGARLPLGAGLLVYVGVTLYGGTASPEPLQVAGFAVSPIIVLGILIGTAQGGVQSLSRSLFAQMLPEGRSGAFFGLYNVVGKGAAILGPLLVGGLAKATGSTQTGLLALLPLFLGGLFLLTLLPPAGERRAVL